MQASLQLEALLRTDWKPQAFLFNNGIVCDRFKALGIPLTTSEESAGLARLIRDAKKAARAANSRIVVSHGYKECLVAAAVSRALKIPLITTYHGLTENLPGLSGCKLRLYRAVELAISRLAASAIVTVSERLAADLGLAGSYKLRVIRNVTNCASASPVTDRPAGDILALGRLVPVKRIDLMLEALALLRRRGRDARLKIAGDGPELQNLSGIAERMKLSNFVEFLGFQSDPAALLRACSLLLIASDSEGIPTTLLEAIAQLTPVVTTDVGGIGEVLESFPGYPYRLVAPGSAEKLADAIDSILTGPPPALDRAAISSTLEETYSPRAAARRHVQMYQELAG